MNCIFSGVANNCCNLAALPQAMQEVTDAGNMM
jgi:hypothetical protein